MAITESSIIHKVFDSPRCHQQAYKDFCLFKNRIRQSQVHACVYNRLLFGGRYRCCFELSVKMLRFFRKMENDTRNQIAFSSCNCMLAGLTNSIRQGSCCNQMRTIVGGMLGLRDAGSRGPAMLSAHTIPASNPITSELNRIKLSKSVNYSFIYICVYFVCKLICVYISVCE